jgi:hypothetical protein
MYEWTSDGCMREPECEQQSRPVSAWKRRKKDLEEDLLT